jgi:protein-S-isoprenylcysteine O-methyltransferase Ste14
MTSSSSGDERAPSGARTAYRLRGLLAALPALGALCVPPHVVAWDLWLGVALIAIGWTVRVWAQMHLGYRMKRRMALVTCGPYRFCRNPIYLANSTIVVGMVVASEAPWPWIPAAIAWCVLVFHGVVAYEEPRLRRTYGDDYRRYCRMVGRWWPARPRRPATCGHRLTREAVVAEAMVPLLLVPLFVRAVWLGYV